MQKIYKNSCYIEQKDLKMAEKKNYIEEMLDMSDLPLDTSDYQSEIPQFFAGCNILITGASGFLGILLIEKLLR